MKKKNKADRIFSTKPPPKGWTMCHEIPFNTDELNVIFEAARILADPPDAKERIMDELDISEEVFLNIFGRLQKHMDTSEEPITDDDPRSGMSGFSKNQLTAAFEKVQNQDDWKAPISAVIDISEGPIVEASIAYFTSTAADFLPIKGKAGKYRVKSIGYRAGPAGDH